MADSQPAEAARWLTRRPMPAPTPAAIAHWRDSDHDTRRSAGLSGGSAEPDDTEDQAALVILRVAMAPATPANVDTAFQASADVRDESSDMSGRYPGVALRRPGSVRVRRVGP